MTRRGSWIATAACALLACGEAPANAASQTARPKAVPQATAQVALPRAEPSPSALFHAAYQRVGDQWSQILFLCDGVEADQVQVVTTPDASGLSTLWTYRKPDLRPTRKIVRLGDEEPGAGQIMRELQQPDGEVFGSVHSVNPGMAGDADATTLPTLSSTTDSAMATQCRWEPRGRILLVDARRSVLVTAEESGGFTYKSFDHARPGKMIDSSPGGTNVPTATVSHGRLIATEPGHETYEFSKGPWTYRVTASADNTAPGASLTVLRGGKIVQTSIASAYQMAAKRIE